MEMPSRQVRRQLNRIRAKGAVPYSRYVPHRAGRISPNIYPRQSDRQAARYAKLSGL